MTLRLSHQLADVRMLHLIQPESCIVLQQLPVVNGTTIQGALPAFHPFQVRTAALWHIAMLSLPLMSDWMLMPTSLSTANSPVVAIL